METVVSGFTFQGRGSSACIVCSTGAPVITDNIFLESWDGIGLYGSNALFQGNTFSDCNRAIHLDESNAQRSSTESRSRNRNGISLVSSDPVIARNVIESCGRGIFVLGHSLSTSEVLCRLRMTFWHPTDIYNEGLQIEGILFTDKREVCVATHNYWGSECPKPRFQNDVVSGPGPTPLTTRCPASAPRRPPGKKNSPVWRSAGPRAFGGVRFWETTRGRIVGCWPRFSLRRSSSGSRISLISPTQSI